jgi:phosphatidylglycerophosphatase A
MGERKRKAQVEKPRPAVPTLPWAVATLGGLGRVPVASGTAGSLAGAALSGMLLFLSVPWYLYAGVAAAAAAAAVWAADAAVKGVGRSDPPVIVVDEAAGMLAAGIALSATLYDLAAAFLLFRLFDVVKPGPLEKLERAPGGWGVVLDDLAAGLLARGTWWLLQQNFDFL